MLYSYLIEEEANRLSETVKRKANESRDHTSYSKVKWRASRNVIYKANKLGESMFVRQSEMLIPEEESGSQSPVSYEEDFEDLSSNVDLYVFNDQMAQGYRGVNINSRHNEESLGELYRKDDIDVSNQEHTAPVYFQSLSLD